MMTDTANTNPSTGIATVGRLDSIGTGAHPADSAPVSSDDRAVIGAVAGTLGKVELVKVGDPEAVTVRGEGACRWSSSIGVVVMELSPTVIPACFG
jgi:hypothetical protein